VHPDVVRAGHGTALLAAALGQAAERGYQQTTLWVLASNAVARAFYERRGFVADGVTKDDDRGDFSLHEVRYVGGVARD
jgi:ribosomal protein S18 acetylase RimI-like enzyme